MDVKQRTVAGQLTKRFKGNSVSVVIILAEVQLYFQTCVKKRDQF